MNNARENRIPNQCAGHGCFGLADGLQIEGRFGDQIMYTLTDERVMYVPPVVRSKLVELVSSPASCSRSARLSASKATAALSNGR